MIDTTEGPVPVEWLTSTHRLITRRGAEPLAGIARLDPAQIENDLVEFAPGAFCYTDDDTHDDAALLVAGGQRLLLTGDDLALYFGLDAALADACDLVSHHGVSIVDPKAGIPVFGLSMRQGAIVRANGLWVEAARADGPQMRSGYPCLTDWECQLIIGLRGEAQQTGWQAVA